MRRLIAGIAFLGVLGAVCSAQAANKLFNGNLELTPADVYYDGFDPSVADDVPGWELFLGAADGSYVLVNGVGSGNVDVDTGNGPAGGGMQTAAGSRVAVAPGLQYVASLTYDNYFGGSGAAYFIDWFESDGDPISSSGGLLSDPNGPFGYDPYGQKLSVVAVAPAGAGLAGVRFTSGNPGYNGLAADNFSFVPEPGMAILAALAACGLATLARCRD
jgi:hypothetical protein